MLSHILFVVMLRIVMLSVVMVNVMAPLKLDKPDLLDNDFTLISFFNFLSPIFLGARAIKHFRRFDA